MLEMGQATTLRVVIMSVAIVSVAVMVVMIITQEKRAEQIDTHADNRIWNGLITGNRHWT